MAHLIVRNSIVDLSLIKLKTKVQKTNTVNIALLPRASQRNELYAEKVAKVCGMGIEEDGTISSNLKFTALKILSQNDCRPFYGIVDPKIMCAKSTNSNASTCNGDSGSPLSVKDGTLSVIVGVVSFGTAFGCNIGKLKF
jgi:chymotrypsin